MFKTNPEAFMVSLSLAHISYGDSYNKFYHFSIPIFLSVSQPSASLYLKHHFLLTLSCMKVTKTLSEKCTKLINEAPNILPYIPFPLIAIFIATPHSHIGTLVYVTSDNSSVFITHAEVFCRLQALYSLYLREFYRIIYEKISKKYLIDSCMYFFFFVF